MGFDTVLVANRGEIAVRAIRTLRRMGIRSVAVHSEADRCARHVAEADVAVHIGPSAAEESYLSARRVVEAARGSGAQAVHPGYGFLSENADFARACAESGVAFIGPPPAAVESMGDKIRAKRTVRAAGVPVVPGRSDPGMSDEDIRAAVLEVGFPALLKPSAGGGGKGMRVIADESDVDGQIAAARREARSAFGDDALLVERYLARPRHVEVQVLADAHGNVVHLGERECSLQRRHQKIVEEAPSPLLDEDLRQRMGAAAVEAARSVGYVGAGTVEFVVSGENPEEFFFLEMNTRLQVEHPVTELAVTVGQQRGIDLVEWQVRIAEGAPIPFAQRDVALTGHAVEARIYAEDPARGFLPTGGEVLAAHEPAGPDVRVDSGISRGTRVGSEYDPMLAKVIARADRREDALRQLDAALADTAILGLNTNTAFLRALLAREDVRAGELDTALVEREIEQLSWQPADDEVYVAAALERLLAAEPAGPVVDPWDVPGGWRLGERAVSEFRFAAPETGGAGGRGPVVVRTRGRAGDAEVALGDGEMSPASADLSPVINTGGATNTAQPADDGGQILSVTYRGRTRRYRCARAGATTWLAAEGRTWALAEHQLLADRAGAAGRGDGQVKSPMPGTVLLAHAASGQRVAAGQALFVVEAMKMEHTVAAPFDGTVSEVRVRSGQPVGLDEPLAVLTAGEED